MGFQNFFHLCLVFREGHSSPPRYWPKQSRFTTNQADHIILIKMLLCCLALEANTICRAPLSLTDKPTSPILEAKICSYSNPEGLKVGHPLTSCHPIDYECSCSLFCFGQMSLFKTKCRACLDQCINSYPIQWLPPRGSLWCTVSGSLLRYLMHPLHFILLNVAYVSADKSEIQVTEYVAPGNP